MFVCTSFPKMVIPVRTTGGLYVFSRRFCGEKRQKPFVAPKNTVPLLASIPAFGVNCSLYNPFDFE